MKFFLENERLGLALFDFLLYNKSYKLNEINNGFQSKFKGKSEGYLLFKSACKQ